jgi:CubicO group peptidase (beta-lactamase class C family)
MLFHKALIASLLGAAGTSAARIVATDEVPLIGPSFISNFDPSGSVAIRKARSELPGLIDNLFKTNVLNRTDLAISIDIFSAATNDSLYRYTHVGENSKKSLTAGTLNDKTISRTGSVTKLFTVYAILAKAGIEVFSHPVTKYLPELGGNSSSDPLERIRWEDITVGALASQQAGSGGIGGLYFCDAFILPGLIRFLDFFFKYANPNDPLNYSSEGVITQIMFFVQPSLISFPRRLPKLHAG